MKIQTKSQYVVTAGDNSISFNSAMDTATYTLLVSGVRVSSNEEAGTNEVSRSEAGFVLYCTKAGTIDFFAYEEGT